MDLSEQLFGLLSEMQTRIEMYLEKKSLEQLYYFLTGYLQGCQSTVNSLKETVNFCFYFEMRFQDFIEKRYPPIGEKNHTISWYKILLQNFSEAEAVDAFFAEIEHFKRGVGVGENSLLYKAPSRTGDGFA